MFKGAHVPFATNSEELAIKYELFNKQHKELSAIFKGFEQQPKASKKTNI